MNIAELDGKPFSLWLTDENDESAVFSGTARWDDSATSALPRFGISLAGQVEPERGSLWLPIQLVVLPN